VVQQRPVVGEFEGLGDFRPTAQKIRNQKSASHALLLCVRFGEGNC
jgi:hypothetical protein